MPLLQCPGCGKNIDASGMDVSGGPISCPECGRAVPPSPGPISSVADTLTARADTGPSPYRGVNMAFLSPGGPNELGWLGQYRVLRLLGQGGMGIVFLAEDTHLQRPVALKVMPPEMASRNDARLRFLREARATAQIRNDHIVAIHQVGQERDVPFIAMEFLEGETLDARLARSPALALPEVLRIGRQIAHGLASAHERGLIHRDIKPSNVWLEAETGRVKVFDFGLARGFQNEQQLTHTGMVVGTPAYMAPEQAEGAQVDHRVDLFSLGCVLYEMSTGMPPFTGPTTVAILKAVALKDPSPLSQVNPSAPAALETLVEQLLAKDPDKRPVSAAVVVEVLRQLESGDQQATHPGLIAPRRPRKSLTRPLLVGLAAVLVLVGVAVAFSLRPKAPSEPGATAPGVTETEIQLGLSGPFSGTARELGRNVELGVQTYFHHVNDQGGIAGRKLRLVALDDSYKPGQALTNVQDLFEQREVFGLIGNVGTPTAEKVLPYVLERNRLFFGAVTGAKVLRRSPPDRSVFNYRASYAEETAAILKYLLDVRKIQPEQVAVFAQQDSFGDAGFDGVSRILRQRGCDPERTLRVGYLRNTTDVQQAVEEVLRHEELKVVVMVAVYRPAARFIHQVKAKRPGLLFTNVSFVSSEALAEELRQLSPHDVPGVIVTQVVPPIDSQSTAVRRYREVLRQYAPNEQPTFASLEGYLAANLLTEGLRRAGRSLTTDTLIEALESIHDLDVGIGTPLRFGPSEHQASHKVWGTVLDMEGKAQELELE